MVGNTVHSKWWYGIAIPAVLEVVGWVSGRFVASSLASGSVTPVEIVIPVVTVFSSIILTPVTVVSLFMDPRRIRKSDTDWNPNPFLWGGLGLVALGIKVFTFTTFLAPIAGLYLVRRYTQIGLRNS